MKFQNIKKVIRSPLKLFFFTVLLTSGTSLFSKPHEYGTLNEAFTLSEAQLQELLIDYFPQEVNLESLFIENIRIYDTSYNLIYEGAYAIYEENLELDELIEQSDFLIYTEDTTYYLLNK